eukprot:6204157-Pleurochrysis_carterae.AAC.3
MSHCVGIRGAVQDERRAHRSKRLHHEALQRRCAGGSVLPARESVVVNVSVRTPACALKKDDCNGMR